MKNYTSTFFVAISAFVFAGCQHGDVQLHDHVKQDLNKMGLTAQKEGESAVQFHDHVKEDAKTFNEYVQLHDHVRQDIEWLKASENKR